MTGITETSQSNIDAISTLERDTRTKGEPKQPILSTQTVDVGGRVTRNIPKVVPDAHQESRD
jgi:hypothetical protein